METQFEMLAVAYRFADDKVWTFLMLPIFILQNYPIFTHTIPINVLGVLDNIMALSYTIVSDFVSYFPKN